MAGDIFPTGFMGTQNGSIAPSDSLLIFGAGPVEIPMQTTVHQDLTIRMGVVNVARLDRLVALIAHKKVDLTPIITHRLTRVR